MASRNGIIAFRNAIFADNAGLSGGSWTIANPLSNLLEISPRIVAESTDPGSASLSADFGSEQSIGLIGISGLGTSSLGKIQVTLAGSDSFDSGEVTAWPQDVTAGTNNPLGNFTLSGVVQGAPFVAGGMTRLFIPDSPVRASSMTVSVTDVGNENSGITIGSVGAYSLWQPSINFKYDWTLTLIDPSDVVRVPRGATFVDRRRMFKRISLVFPFLPESEFWGIAFDMLAASGRTEPIWVVPYTDPTQAPWWEKAAVYGLISRDSELSNPLFGYGSLPLQVDQL